MKKRIVLIPDVQAKPGVDFRYLRYAGQFIAQRKPDIVVCIGDFADMPSLSMHDQKGSKSMEGKRYRQDIQSAHDAMQELMAPIKAEKGYKPRLVLTLGNHENRIIRAVENDPKLDGLISMDDLQYKKWGWEVYPFLQPVVIEGIAFCHYFCSGVMGRPITSAQALLTKKHMSCVAGHQQGRNIAYAQTGEGRNLTALICGSFYEHDEDYLNTQTNNHWRGLYIFNRVENGSFDETAVAIEYLKETYGAVCPRCKSDDSQSRGTDRGGAKRRSCNKCGKHWNVREVANA